MKKVKPVLGQYLYLLPFLNSRFFKIGISTLNLNRVYTHHKTYGIDFRKSLIISAPKSRTLKNLERHLLNVFDEHCTQFYGMDGYREIRKIENFDSVLNEIKSQNKQLGLSITSLSEILEKIPQNIIQKGLESTHLGTASTKYKVRFYRLFTINPKLKEYFFFSLDKECQAYLHSIDIANGNLIGYPSIDKVIDLPKKDVQPNHIYFGENDMYGFFNLKDIKYIKNGKDFMKFQPLMTEELNSVWGNHQIN
ncbi:MAG: hypothetical protein RIR12_1672 [Bacteroidota bacterium]|jgi:hypothetical protein